MSTAACCCCWLDYLTSYYTIGVSTHECCFNAPVLGARLMFGCPGFLLQGDGNMFLLLPICHLAG